MKLYIECCESSKNKGNAYTVLKADFPVKKGVLVSMETEIMLLMADITPSQLYSMKIGDKIPILIDNK
jgi:hypothetical protein